MLSVGFPRQFTHVVLAVLGLGTFFLAVPAPAQVPSSSSAPSPTTVVQVSEHIEWLASFDAARTAAKPDQVIVVDVSTDWCTWCRDMETQIYPDAAVRAVASDNVFVKINPKDGAEGQTFAQKQKVKAYPTIFVFSANGKLLKKQVGAFDSGGSFANWVRSASRSPIADRGYPSASARSPRDWNATYSVGLARTTT